MPTFGQLLTQKPKQDKQKSNDFTQRRPMFGHGGEGGGDITDDDDQSDTDHPGRKKFKRTDKNQ
jgi:hypothetical protein